MRKANLVAWLGPPEPGGLILSGHLDVVPFAGQPGWTREPLRLAAEGDRLYGRGTSDMKGFLAQCLAAARRLDPASLERPLVFVFTCDEEIGCLGAERLRPVLGALLGELPLPRLCWIGEPTRWRVLHAHKGIVAFEVEARGRGGHSSVPEAGVNAIALAARAIAAIGELQAELAPRPRRGVARDLPRGAVHDLQLRDDRGRHRRERHRRGVPPARELPPAPRRGSRRALRARARAPRGPRGPGLRLAGARGRDRPRRAPRRAGHALAPGHRPREGALRDPRRARARRRALLHRRRPPRRGGHPLPRCAARATSSRPTSPTRASPAPPSSAGPT